MFRDFEAFNYALEIWNFVPEETGVNALHDISSGALWSYIRACDLDWGEEATVYDFKI